MKAKDNEIILIYNSEKQKDKEVLGYAKSIKDHKLNETDISKSMLTERQIAEIASDLDKKIEEMVEASHAKYKTIIKDKSFSEEELLKLLKENPELLKTPVAYIDKKVFMVNSQYELINEGLEIEGVKSQEANKFEK